MRLKGRAKLEVPRSEVMRALNVYWLGQETCNRIEGDDIVAVSHPNMGKLSEAQARVPDVVIIEVSFEVGEDGVLRGFAVES